jgi:hypothetical protein
LFGDTHGQAIVQTPPGGITVPSGSLPSG